MSYVDPNQCRVIHGIEVGPGKVITQNIERALAFQRLALCANLTQANSMTET